MLIQSQRRKTVFTLACVWVMMAGCDTSERGENEMTNGVGQSASSSDEGTQDEVGQPNKAILDEVNGAGAWFRAKKTAPLWAKKLEEDQTVQTLEGPTEASAGDFLCRGAAGEFWPQGADRIAEKYEPTEEVDADGFRKFLPKSEVMAAQVDHDFKVRTSWGLLEGKSGDFILKNFDDREVDYPESAWIVDKQLFADTYQRIEENQ